MAKIIVKKLCVCVSNNKFGLFYNRVLIIEFKITKAKKSGAATTPLPTGGKIRQRIFSRPAIQISISYFTTLAVLTVPSVIFCTITKTPFWLPSTRAP